MNDTITNEQILAAFDAAAEGRQELPWKGAA